MSDVLARPRRSYSRLDTWQQCPQAYKAKYVDKLPEEPSVWSVGGTAFHTVAEKLMRGDLGPQPGEPELFPAWLEAFRGAYDDVVSHPRFVGDRNMATWRKAARGTEDQDWWLQEGYRMVLRFARWKATTGAGLSVYDDGRPMLERHIEVELGGVPVILIPDAVVVDEHGQVGILDYKTGKPPKKPTQLHFYAAGLAEAEGLHAAWGLYYMARPGQLLATELPMYQHDEVIGQLVEFDERERAGDYDLQPGQECLAYRCPTHSRSKRR